MTVSFVNHCNHRSKYLLTLHRTVCISLVGQDDVLETRRSLEFWSRNGHVYSKLVPIAKDLHSSPASQAYVEVIERFFSACGLLITGKESKKLDGKVTRNACIS